MKILVDVPDEEYDSYALAITFGMGSVAIRRILNGTPLPEGAEILTAEAYSDLCLRASHERKTGRWIDVGGARGLIPSNDFKCSVCGNILDFNGVNAGRGDANYCPHCGAKMEGAKE